QVIAVRKEGGYFFGAAALAAAVGRPGEALNALTTDPSATFHTFTSPLNDPDAIRLPSGLTATANTWSVWPLSVLTLAPVSAFQTRTVWSALQVTSNGF